MNSSQWPQLRTRTPSSPTGFCVAILDLPDSGDGVEGTGISVERGDEKRNRIVRSNGHRSADGVLVDFFLCLYRFGKALLSITCSGKPTFAVFLLSWVQIAAFGLYACEQCQVLVHDG